MDEDEDISINSTEEDEFFSEEEFLVERVVAERTNNDRKEYLLSWLGYPEEASTWEPHEHIQDEDILKTWNERKAKEKAGEESPYDVEKFEASLRKLAEEKAKRKRLRKVKRRRVDLPVSPSEEDYHQVNDSDSSIEAVEVDEIAENYQGMNESSTRKVSKDLRKSVKVTVRGEHVHARAISPEESATPRLDGQSLPSSSGAGNVAASKQKGADPADGTKPYAGTARTSVRDPENSKRPRADSQSSSDTPLAVKRARLGSTQRKALSRSITLPIKEKTNQLTLQPSFVRTISSRNTEDLRKASQSTSTRGSSSRGRGATRGASSLVAKRPKTLIAISSDPRNPSKFFKSYSIRRKAELQGRGLADTAPDVSAVGGLFDPSRPETYPTIKPSEIRRQVLGTKDSEIGSGLFVTDDEHSQSVPHHNKRVVPGVFIAPPYQAPSRGPPPDPSRATCFFFDRKERHPNKPGCRNGALCPFIHGYERDVPVAQPPEGFVEKDEDSVNISSINNDGGTTSLRSSGHSDSRFICFFWDRGQKLSNNPGCTKGICHYLHAYDLGGQIRPPPPGWKEPDISSSNHQPSPSGRPYDSNSLGHRADNSTSRNAPNSLSTSSHSPSANTVAESSNLFPPRTNPPTAPRGSQAICYRWYESGSCPNRDTCDYQHTNAPGARIAPRPVDAPKTDFPNSICYFWARDGHCNRGEGCKFLHRFEYGVPLAPEPRSVILDSSNISSSPINHNPELVTRDWRKQETCKFWVNGYCRKADACPFRHGDASTSTHASAPASETMASDDLMRSLITPRPRKKTVSFAEDDQGTEGQDALTMGEKRQHKEHNVAESKIRNTRSAQEVNDSISSNTVKMPIRPPEEPQAARNTQAITAANLSPASLQNDNIYRMKELAFPGSETMVVDFCDLIQAEPMPMIKQFLAIPKLRFDRMCTAQDFSNQTSFHRSDTLWQGNLKLPAQTDATAPNICSWLAYDLSIRMSGLVSVCPGFTVLLYSASEEWSFLGIPESDFKTKKLKFLIFKYGLEGHHLIKTNPVLNTDGTALEPVPHRKDLVKKIFNMRLKDMLPSHNPKNCSLNFYLMFPSNTKGIADFLASWIFLSGQGAKVYNSQDEGSWEVFARGLTIESGTVFLHESFAPHMYRVPWLQDAVKKNCTFWSISETASDRWRSHLYQDESNITNLGGLSVTRLLPHGHVFLLTPGFIIAEPKRVQNLLDWFFGPSTQGTVDKTKPKGKFESSTRGTWKLIACHKLADYVLELANSKVVERKAFELAHRDEPSFEQMLEDKGLDFTTCKERYAIHKKLVELEMENRISFSSDKYGLGSPDELYHPIVYADSSIDPDDEIALVEWFAFWSLRELDMYRKFTVIGTSPKTLERATRLKDVTSQQQAHSQNEENGLGNFRAFSMNKRSTADLSDISSSPKEAALKKARAIATKLMSKSTAGTVSPQTASPNTNESSNGPGRDTENQALELEVAAATGHSRPLFNPRVLGQNNTRTKAGNPPGQPAADQTRSDQTDMPPLQHQQQEVITKEIRFEPTVTWYQRQRASGNGFEHLFVDSWERAFANLGIPGYLLKK